LLFYEKKYTFIICCCYICIYLYIALLPYTLLVVTHHTALHVYAAVTLLPPGSLHYTHGLHGTRLVYPLPAVYTHFALLPHLPHCHLPTLPAPCGSLYARLPHTLPLHILLHRFTRCLGSHTTLYDRSRCGLLRFALRCVAGAAPRTHVVYPHHTHTHLHIHTFCIYPCLYTHTHTHTLHFTHMLFGFYTVTFGLHTFVHIYVDICLHTFTLYAHTYVTAHLVAHTQRTIWVTRVFYLPRTHVDYRTGYTVTHCILLLRLRLPLRDTHVGHTHTRLRTHTHTRVTRLRTLHVFTRCTVALGLRLVTHAWTRVYGYARTRLYIYTFVVVHLLFVDIYLHLHTHLVLAVTTVTRTRRTHAFTHTRWVHTHTHTHCGLHVTHAHTYGLRCTLYCWFTYARYGCRLHTPFAVALPGCGYTHVVYTLPRCSLFLVTFALHVLVGTRIRRLFALYTLRCGCALRTHTLALVLPLLFETFGHIWLLSHVDICHTCLCYGYCLLTLLL